MILNKEQIKMIAHGCIDIKEYDGFYELQRFTDKQIDFYKTKEEETLYFSRFTAGVSLCFITDAPSFKFEYKLERFRNRIASSADLYVDGMLMQIYRENRTDGTDVIEYTFENNGMHKVELYLPYTANMQIRNVEIADNAILKPVEYTKKVLFLGDSITQGFDSRYTSFTYATQVARFFDVDMVNHGIGGYYADSYSLDADFPYNPDIVVVAYGSNDWRTYDTVEDYRVAATRYFAKLFEIYPNQPKLINIPWWRMDAYAPVKKKKMGDFALLRTALREIVSKYNNIVITDGFMPIPHLTEFFGEDGRVHPNELTMGKMAQYFEKSMLPFFEEK